MPNQKHELSSESERHTDDYGGGQSGSGAGKRGKEGYWEERDVQSGGDAGAVLGGGHRDENPPSYTRSDKHIREAVVEALTDDVDVDATHIEVVVKNGDVILTGVVDNRRQERAAEDIARQTAGVHDVQNSLRID